MKQIIIVCQHAGYIIPASLECMLNVYNEFSIQKIEFEDLESAIKENQSASTLFLILHESKDFSTLLDRIGKIKQDNTESPVLVFNIIENKIDDIKELLKIGRIGIISKSITPETLHENIKALYKKEWVLGSDIQEKLMNDIFKNDAKNRLPELNETEVAIINAAKKGASIQDTAKEMGLSKNTIAAYRSKLIKKLGVHSIGQVLALHSEN